MLYRQSVSVKPHISINVPLLIITVLAGFLLVTIPVVINMFSDTQGSVPQVGGVTNQISLAPQRVSLSRTVLLKENVIHPETGISRISVTFTPEQQAMISKNGIAVEYHINVKGLQTFEFTSSDGAEYFAEINSTDFEPAVYTLVVTVGEVQTEPVNFTVTYPLYVTWTFDWEGYDVKQEYLDTIARQSNEHGMPITHFYNPRIYTNPEVSAERAEELTNWVIDRRDSKGDAIGLHLHMQPDMVQAAGVTVREDAAQWGSNLNDGYDVLTSEYSYDDMVKMLNWSKNLFEKKGLGTPSMYRAGGWYADEETLQAVHDTGFIMDSSARTEYTFGADKVQGPWTTAPGQNPYRLNLKDQNDVNGNSKLWEFPNTGADSWSFSAQQMIERFELQHEEVLAEPRVVTFLSHPEWYNVDAPKIDQVFSHTDQFLNSSGEGNVVYATLSSVYTVWESK